MKGLSRPLENDASNDDYADIIEQPNPPVFQPTGLDIRNPELHDKYHGLLKKKRKESLSPEDEALLKQLHAAAQEYRDFKDAKAAYFEAHPEMLEKSIEGAWQQFVEESEDGGRNPHMVSLFLRMLNAGADEETIVDEAYRRYSAEWPDDIDPDAYEQLERAANKAMEIHSEAPQGAGMKSTTDTKASRKEAEAIELAKTAHSPASILAEAVQLSEADRFAFKDPNAVYVDDSTETLAAFVVDTLRAVHGMNAHVFLGHQWQSAHDCGCWLYTGQPAKTRTDDALVNALTKRLEAAERDGDYPEFVCNCNFQQPQSHGTHLKDGKDVPVGHRRFDFASRVVSFTVECDMSLSTGKTPETDEEKATAKTEQREMIQWIYTKLRLYPVLVVDSGNKSIQATYLLDTTALDKQKSRELMHHLGQLFSVLGADPAVFTVPHVTRAPQMFRRIGEGDGAQYACQKCLHFDPAAERYSLPDVIQRLENALGLEPVSLDRRSITSAGNGMLGGRPRSETESNLASGFLDSRFRDDNGVLLLHHYLENWYRYDGHGWRLLSESDLKSMLEGYLQEEAVRRASMAEALPNVKTDLYTLNSVLANLKSDRLCALPRHIYPEPPFLISTRESCPNRIAFRNGILDVCTAADVLERDASGDNAQTLADALRQCLAPCTPDFFDLTAMPYDFLPDATCPMFENFLGTVQPEQQTREVIQMMFGWALSGSTEYQIGFILLGEGGTGKSTLLELLIAMMGGMDCVSAVSYDQFGERFSLFPLTQHKLNVCNEMPEIIGDNRENAKREAVFKSLCCGETYAVEEKGKPVIPRKLIARPVFATNKMPFISDKSSGVYRRLRLIPFSTKGDAAGEVVRDYHKRILEADELPGIALWALKGLGRLRRLTAFPECESGSAMLRKFREMYDPLGCFLRETLEKAPDGEISERDLIDRYKRFMCLDVCTEVRPAAFARAMTSVFTSAHRTRTRCLGGREWCWKGVRFKEE